jgi:hypothetical protein
MSSGVQNSAAASPDNALYLIGVRDRAAGAVAG